MKFYNYLNEDLKYNNWVFPDKNTIKSDFTEYKKKEDRKWKNRSNTMGFRFPIFNDLEHFTNELKNGKVIELKGSIINKITHMTSIDNMNQLKDMVQSYHRPRDIDRIIKGFENNDKIPYGIILKGKNGYHIMAGNTRSNSARILGITPKMLLIDVSN